MFQDWTQETFIELLFDIELYCVADECDLVSFLKKFAYGFNKERFCYMNDM